MFKIKRRLNYSCSTCRGSKIWGLDWSPLLCSGVCAALGRLGGLPGVLGRCFFIVLRDCVCGLVHGWGWVQGPVEWRHRLCLGSWLWGWMSWRPIDTLGLVMALSFPSFSFILWPFGLTCLLTGASL